MATSRSLVETIALAHFMANAAQVEQLAHNVAEGQMADSTYLRVTLAHMQSKLGRPRRGKQAAQEPVLDSIHEALYPSVLKGVGPEGMDQTERFRKATFARSAASTIRYFIRGGGDVRGIDVATATKSGLRKAVQPETPAEEGETRNQKSFRKAGDAVLRSAQRLARGDPEDARERVDALMDQLQALLDELGAPAQPEHGATTTIVAGRAAPRGTPAQPAQLHRGA